MATLLTVISVVPTVDGTRISTSGLEALVSVDRDADLGAGEAGGAENYTKVFSLPGLTKGQTVGLHWGTVAEATNTFNGVHHLELRPA